MKILVTGGAGFIGSHLVDKALEEGYDVVTIDNLNNGKLENLNKDAKFYKVDIVDIDNLSLVFEKEKPDYIIHLAAQISLRESLKNPIYDAEQNILGSINVLEGCRKFNVKKVVYASSAAVYGFPKYLPVDEKHPINPFSPYGVSKHTVEHYLNSYYKNFDLDYVILRYSNVYGERQASSGEAGVISIFIDVLKKKEKPVIFGDGKQTRDFIYVKDVAKANLLALEKETNSKIFNISTNTETSVNKVFKIIKEIMNSNINPTYEKPIKEVKNIRLDNSLVKKELDWKPKVELNEGLKKIVKEELI